MTSWLNLAHRTAIVTGGGSGIGATTAKALYREGCNVVLADTNEVAVKKVAESCTQLLQRGSDGEVRGIYSDSTDALRRLPSAACVLPVVCDVTKQSDVHSLIREADKLAKDVYDKFKARRTTGSDQNRLESSLPPQIASIIINSAGITRDGLVHNISINDYDSVLDVNLKGTFLACQEFCAPPRLESMCETSAEKGLSIINIGSVISESGNIGQTNYAASKGGVVGLTRALAKEMAFLSSQMQKQKNSGDAEEEIDDALPFVRVNAILPGFIASPMSNAVPQRTQARIKNKIAMKRFGKPEDIANIALFLASNERSGYITGECWECSGMISL